MFITNIIDCKALQCIEKVSRLQEVIDFRLQSWHWEGCGGALGSGPRLCYLTRYRLIMLHSAVLGRKLGVDSALRGRVVEFGSLPGLASCRAVARKSGLTRKGWRALGANWGDHRDGECFSCPLSTTV